MALVYVFGSVAMTTTRATGILPDTVPTRAPSRRKGGRSPIVAGRSGTGLGAASAGCSVPGEGGAAGSATGVGGEAGGPGGWGVPPGLHAAASDATDTAARHRKARVESLVMGNSRRARCWGRGVHCV